MSGVCILSKIQQIHPFVPQRKALPSCLSPSAENNSSRPGRSISDAKCLLRWTPSHFQLTKCFSRGAFTGTFRSGDVRARSPCLLSLSRIKLRAFHGLGASQKRNLEANLTQIRKRSTRLCDSSWMSYMWMTAWRFSNTNFPLQSQYCQYSTTSSNRIDQVFQPPTLALPSKPKTSVQPQKLKACPVAWAWVNGVETARGD